MEDDAIYLKNMLENMKKCEASCNYYIMKPNEITVLLDYINTINSLLEIRIEHISVLFKVIKHLQNEMKLAIDERIDREDETNIIKELIFWIDQLEEAEQ